ncbi:MAG: MBL fold metallo-hydrolase [Phycisphaerales bacterium JB063]
MPHPTLKLGRYTLDVVAGGTMHIDGGNMFGVVPKSLWSRYRTADEWNRIECCCNNLLIRGEVAGQRRTVLVDTGNGGKWDDKMRSFMNMQPGNPILESLASLGVAPEAIDTVILTHLHNDHAGGATKLNDAGQAVPAFPNARHIVQRKEWDDATGRRPELAGAYFADDFVPLGEAGLVDIVDGEVEVLPGIKVVPTGGHTLGHQMIVIEGDTGDAWPKAVYACDLCPTATHLHTNWCLAYDQHMRETRRVKPIVLGDVADTGALLLFAHDPEHYAATLKRDDRKHFAIADEIK